MTFSAGGGEVNVLDGIGGNHLDALDGEHRRVRPARSMPSSPVTMIRMLT